MRARLAVALGLRVVLFALLAYGLARPDLPQFHGKGIPLRAGVYPVLSSAVVAVWLLRRGRDRFPWDVDALIVLPFIFDAGGNAANLYDRIWWWDKLEHGVNWFVLAGAVSLLLTRSRLAAGVRAGLAIGFGAVTAIVWELSEYVTFIHSNHRELRTAYTNTLGDLLWGLTGSIVAAVAIAYTTRSRATVARCAERS